MKLKLTKGALGGCLVATLFLPVAQSALQAQQQQQSATPQAVLPQTTANPAQAETTSGVTRVVDQYHIGARDVLTIRVTAGHIVPELSVEADEVDECGRIPVLSVEQEEQNE